MLEKEGMVEELTGDRALALIKRIGKHAHCMTRKVCHVIDDEK
jgi:hypothetical protein